MIAGMLPLYKRIFLAFFAGIIGGALPIVVAGLFSAPYADSSTWVAHVNSTSFQLLNLTFNSLHAWTIDPITHALLEISSNLPFAAVFAWYSILFTIGLTLLLLRATELNTSQTLLTTIATSATIFCLVGFDLTLWSSLAWLPWLGATLLHVLRQSRLTALSLLTILLFTLLHILYARFLAFYTILPLLIPLFWIAKDASLWREFKRSGNELWVILVTISTLLFASCFLAGATFPPYPPGGIVFELPYVSHTLFGPEPYLQLINTPKLASYVYQPSLLLLLVIAFSALCVWREVTKVRRSLIFSTVLLATFLVLLSCPPHWIRELSPLAALSRILPGLNLIPLPVYTSALVIFMTAVALPRVVAVLLLGCVGLLVTQEYRAPLFIDASAQPSFATLWEKSDQTTLTKEVVNSPSFPLLAEFGPRNQTLRSCEALSLHARYRRRWIAAAKASHHEEDLTFLLDQNDRTRWSPLQGQQSGDEWIELTFANPKQICGIEVTTGNFSSDYPRGLEIETCGEIPAVKLFSAHPWRGQLLWTKNGYPYLLPPRKVVARFAAPQTISCLRIRQTGKDAQFDWSVSAIRLLIPSNSADFQPALPITR